MIRSPRRPGLNDPVAITPERALEFELSHTWPAGGERRQFWSRAEIPDHLAEVRAPDPRRVLGDLYEARAYHRDLDDWTEARLDWLRRVVHG